jgi:hypothetical protein
MKQQLFMYKGALRNWMMPTVQVEEPRETTLSLSFDPEELIAKLGRVAEQQMAAGAAEAAAAEQVCYIEDNVVVDAAEVAVSTDACDELKDRQEQQKLWAELMRMREEQNRLQNLVDESSARAIVAEGQLAETRAELQKLKGSVEAEAESPKRCMWAC